MADWVIGRVAMGEASHVAVYACSGVYGDFVVPGVTVLTADLYGAAGSAPYFSTPNSPGLGGHVKCDVAVTPGEILRVYVGCAGTAVIDTTGPGGFNGGGEGAGSAGGGGGATDIRRSPYGLADRLVIAPGGGGAGACHTSGFTTGSGGDGGTPIGVDGASGSSFTKGGGGGTASGGGSGGGVTVPGGAGSIGQGGYGGFGNIKRGGGGGGGGYYGGGGGSGKGDVDSGGGGGGGGSGLSTGVNETLETGVRVGDGEATLTW